MVDYIFQKPQNLAVKLQSISKNEFSTCNFSIASTHKPYPCMQHNIHNPSTQKDEVMNLRLAWLIIHSEFQGQPGLKKYKF